MNRETEQKAKEFLGAHGYALDTNHRRVSFGQHAADSFLNIGKNAPALVFEIANGGNVSKTVIVCAQNSIYQHDLARLKTKITGDENALILTDGTLLTEEGNPVVTAATKDATRKIEDFRAYLDRNPTQILDFKLESSDLQGAVNSTNFNQTFRFVYADPFRDPVTTAEIQLRDFRNDQVQASQYIDIAAFKEGYEIQLSDQNFFAFSIEPKTKLIVSMRYGAQMSNAQDLYRTIKRAGKSLDILNGPRKNC